MDRQRVQQLVLFYLILVLIGCRGGFDAMPDAGFASPPDCQEDTECQWGCRCAGRRCVPVNTRVDPGYCSLPARIPTCLESDLLITTASDTVDATDGLMSLREALLAAAADPGPHHIAFAADIAEVSVSISDLPALPSLTYLDGGLGVRMVAGTPSPSTGLILEEPSVVVAGLEIVGFPQAGIDIGPNAQQVHLFHMTLGSPDLPNGAGLQIRSGAKHIFVGRGRELACIVDPSLPLLNNQKPADITQYRVNQIVGNLGDGIRADGVEDLRIYGTWVGFHTRQDLGHHDPKWGNGGVGIRLTQVQQAIIGSQLLTDSESFQGPDDPYLSFVAVGRNLGGGVLIQGGGDILMPGLFLGDTPSLSPYDQNQQFGLKIQQNQGTVTYGPALEATGQDALSYGLLYTEGSLPIWIDNAQGEVWIRQAQIECLQDCLDQGGAAHAIQIDGGSAAIHLVHLTLLYYFMEGAVAISQLESGGSVEMINNLIFWVLDRDRLYPLNWVPAVKNEGDLALRLDHNMKFQYGAWCEGACDGLDLSSDLSPGSFVCTSQAAIPLATNCPNVDAGTTILANGRPLDVNGSLEGAYNGCAPDIGFMECCTPACRNVVCP